MKRITLLLVLLMVGVLPAAAQDDSGQSSDAAINVVLLPDVLTRGDDALTNSASDEAIRDYSLFILLNPTISAGYFARAQSYAQANRLELALQDIDRTIGLLVEMDEGASLNAAVYSLRGSIHVAQQKYDEAIDDFTRSIDYAPTYQALASRGLLYAQTNQPEPALDDLTQAINQQGSSPVLLIYRASIQNALEEPVAAAQDYATFIEAVAPNLIDLPALRSGQGLNLPFQAGTAYRLSFTAEAGQLMRALATPNNGSVDPLLVLLDPDDNPLIANDDTSGINDGSALILDYEIPQDGTYALLIGTSLGGNSGEVALRFELVDAE